MSHLASNAAIFSPSVARAAASTAKDWSFVDAWLASKFRPRPPPTFERNSDTLRALLALATLNESADDQRRLLDRVERSALAEIELQPSSKSQRGLQDQGSTAPAAENSTEESNVRDALLTALEASLTRDGRAALDAMAAASTELGLASPTPAAISASLVSVASQTADVKADAGRVATLRRHADAQIAEAESLAAEVQGPAYRPPADLAKLNLDTQRRIRGLEAKVPELRDRAAALAAGVPSLTVEQVRAEEEAYLALLQQKKELDARVRVFQGLPPDTAQARRELESRRAELQRLTQRRDAVFEGLVERETPRKPR
ncbi:hypothetical protein MGG_03567 [Pyricularia oryzae 70-15]|uniref:HAUS augmin-like complex subunit 1 n=3 Tax=Pyricularia oryzae TaxID=318829 RepID=G4N7M4_PYRO7|nr:uncharacterized protein MGG_03567 [Pyricularia oryzae 70-15]EHA50029.1 hypothetical protein MGG_03567 [Pyricularia oryzae 70-15]ELQ39527.1 hypothetical protein OOU_Y34scaffold00495g6 [Pyricularia oryzae Y34]KAI7921630.1 hypothetical protein M9X92_005280 [Pyricularia oryzae]KAI7923450.1 hypothetical protein M0657_005182 [Pyricularia oryzae]